MNIFIGLHRNGYSIAKSCSSRILEKEAIEISNLLGKQLIYTDNRSFKKARRALSSGLSNVGTRITTPILLIGVGSARPKI